MNTSSQAPIVIYQEADREVEVRLDSVYETVWLTQAQMAELFGKDVRTVNEHLLNVYSEGELERDSTIRKFRICLLYTSPSPRDRTRSRMPSSA